MEGTAGTRVCPEGVYLINLDVVGLQYYDWAAVSEQIVEHDMLMLVREPDNPYDTLAIKVVWAKQGLQIGHIPRNQNSMLARLMDVGLRFVGLHVTGPPDHYRTALALYYLPAQKEAQP